MLRNITELFLRGEKYFQVIIYGQSPREGRIKMRTYKVGICDADTDYSTALMDYANGNKEFGISLSAFSSLKAIKDYLTVQDLDLILTDDLSACKALADGYEFQEIKVIPLIDFIDETDDSANGRHADTGIVRYIFKYQRADIICKDIRRALTADGKNVRELKSVIAVYSPIGRCGKTRLARALAANDEVRGGLYVSMEDFGTDIGLSGNEVLYLLKSKSPELEKLIFDRITTENGINVLNLSSTYLDTHDVSFDDVEMLKGYLLKTGRFTSVVFDIGSAAIEDFRILSLFDRVYMPVLRDEVSLKKLEVFVKMLKDMGLRSIISKLISVDVPDAEVGSNEMIKTLWEIKKDGD